MTRQGWLAALGMLICFLTGQAYAAPCLALSGDAGYERLASATVELAYRFAPQPLAVGTFFSAEIVVCAPDTAIDTVRLDARMPAHGHGMNYRPTSTQLRPGHFRVEGLMLHMPGRWEFTFEVIQGEKHTRLTRVVELKP